MGRPSCLHVLPSFSPFRVTLSAEEGLEEELRAKPIMGQERIWVVGGVCSREGHPKNPSRTPLPSWGAAPQPEIGSWLGAGGGLVLRARSGWGGQTICKWPINTCWGHAWLGVPAPPTRRGRDEATSCVVLVPAPPASLSPPGISCAQGAAGRRPYPIPTPECKWGVSAPCFEQGN